MAWFERDQYRIYYEEAGVGDPLLLMTGWGGSIDEFRALRDVLASNFRVIAADAPGSGKSGPQPRTYTTSYYREDAAVLLEMLDALSASPAHLAGFSDGGEYALLMAATKLDAARSIVTWGAAGSLGDNVMMADAMATVVDDPIPPMAGFSEHMKQVYGEDGARIMTQSAATSFRAIIEAGGDISRSMASNITCPALLITGEHDFLASPALVSDMARAMPNAEFVEVAGAGHPVHIEQPDVLIERVTRWLSKR
jgi:valacyclovir hydrolase